MISSSNYTPSTDRYCCGYLTLKKSKACLMSASVVVVVFVFVLFFKTFFSDDLYQVMYVLS